MNSLVLAVELVGAIGIGYLTAFAYMKLTLKDKYENNLKHLRDTVNAKDADLIELKKELRNNKNEVLKLEAKEQELTLQIEDEKSTTDRLSKKIESLQKEIKNKNLQIQELEELLLTIQEDYTQLEDTLNKNKDDFKKDIEKLTQKANDLYMVKGTEELKSAKEVFDNLREKALNKL